MRKYILFLLLALVMVLPFAMSSPVIYAQQQESSQEAILYLDNYPNSHYYHIGEVMNFAKHGTTVYYTNESMTVDAYDLTTNTLQSLAINAVQFIRPYHNGILYISEGFLYQYDGTTSKKLATADQFDYYESDTNNMLCYTVQDQLYLASLDTTNYNQLQSLSSVNLTETYGISISTIKSITATEKGCIVLTETAGPTIELYHILPNGNFHATISNTLMDCSMVKYAKVNNQGVLAILYRNQIALITITDELEWNLSPINLDSTNQSIYTPTYIDFIDNQLLVSDTTKKNIKIFEFDHFDAIQDMTMTTLLGSNGSNIDQYDRVTDIYCKTNDDILVNDAGNHRIKRIQNGSTYASDIFEYDSDLTIQRIKVNAHNQTVILSYSKSQQTSYIQFYQDRDLSSPIQTITLSSLVYDFWIDDENKVYYCKNDGIYLDDTKIIAYALQNPTLYYLPDTDTFLCIDGSMVLDIDLIQATIVDSWDFELDYIDKTMDYHGNLYLLQDTTLTKYQLQNQSLIQQDQVVLQRKYEKMALDQESGKFYLFDTINSCIYTYENTAFCDGMQSYQDISKEVVRSYDQLASLSTFTTSSVYISPYPNAIGQLTELSSTLPNKEYKMAVVTLETVGKYAHIVYFDEDSMLQDGYIASYYLQSKNIQTSPKSYYVISKTANVYYLPTQVATTTTILESNTQVQVISKNVTDIVGSPVEFLAIELNGTVAYVLQNDLLPSSMQTPTTNTVQNATIITKDDYVTVYTSPDKTSEVLTTLLNGTRVYLVDYQEDSEFTKIKYLNANHEEVEGYVLTTVIQPDKMSNIVLICIVLSIVAIVILVVVIYNIVKLKQKYMK